MMCDEEEEDLENKIQKTIEQKEKIGLEEEYDLQEDQAKEKNRRFRRRIRFLRRFS